MGTASWWPPFDGLDGRERGRRLIAMVVVAVVSLVVMFVALPAGDETIVGFELAGDEEASRYLDAWRDPGLWRVTVAVLVDFPFLVAYGVGGAMGLDWLAGRSRSLSPSGSRFLARAAWLPLVAAGFDALENLALLVVLTDRVDTWPDLARSMASVKFALLIVAATAAAVAGGLAAMAVMRERRVTG